MRVSPSLPTSASNAWLRGRTRPAIAVVAVVVGLFLVSYWAGCSGGTSTKGPSSTAGTSGPPVDGGRLVVARGGDADSLLPLCFTEAIADDVVSLTYPALTYGGFADGLQGAELAEQRFLALRADAGDAVEGGLDGALAAHGAMDPNVQVRVPEVLDPSHLRGERRVPGLVDIEEIREDGLLTPEAAIEVAHAHAGFSRDLGDGDLLERTVLHQAKAGVDKPGPGLVSTALFGGDHAGSFARRHT